MKVRGGSGAPFEEATEPVSGILQSSNTWDQADSASFFQEEYSNSYSSRSVPERSFRTPSINISKMAQAIRWTSEMNRKLHAAAEERRLLVDPNYAFQQVPQFHASNLEPLRGGGGGGDCTTAAYRIPLVGVEDPTVSIFHAPNSRGANERHSLRWESDFKEYLARLVEVLAPQSAKELQPSGAELELSLAMIYLDRATSLETPRAAGVPPCPFATPRTSKRLALTAVLLAVSSVRGIEDLTHFYAKIETAFGIPPSDCHKMVGWMRAALGDAGIFVTPADMREWKPLWEGRFA